MINESEASNIQFPETETFALVTVDAPTTEEQLELYDTYLGMGGDPLPPLEDLRREHRSVPDGLAG